jgi:recombinational DNA repair protein (RecF pathway)
MTGNSVRSQKAHSAPKANNRIFPLFCLSEFVLTEGGGMPYVSTADVLKGFYGINKEIERLAGAGYCMELTDVLYEDKMAEPLAFRLITTRFF